MISPARRAAHRVLRAVHTGRADLATALERARGRLDDSRDRALAGAIATGTLRWRAAIDHLLAQVSERPLGHIDAGVLDVLRSSAFELRFLDRVPARATVHDAVSLTRAVARPGAERFVNGLLRRLSDPGCTASLPPPPPAGAEKASAGALDYLAITLSHPRWLAERWLDRHGFDAAAAWARFDNEPAPVTLHANRLRGAPAEIAERLAAEGVRTSAGRWAPRALTARDAHPGGTPAFARGDILLQDEAAQLVAALVAARPGMRVLDACAAPGGKTVDLAGAMGGRGVLVAADLRPRRLAVLKETVRRCGAACVHVVRLDATAPLPFVPVFDRVLVDAPCSGLGTLRSDPDIRWRVTPSRLAALALRQDAFLARAAGAVRPGGRLVYATCSSEPEENEHVVARFRRTHPHFEAVRPAAPEAARFVDAESHFRTLPFRDGLQAFFGAVLRRRT
ncbi:MAG: 16S rRNA (cytosine(967)-C(5))-methyltransferase RsmB [Acidobacteria bacterium]|nr:16S rRNA (cytosine(967)-C(5))-methyltransferase RsmB [Acidobacteriota bacterium]